MKNIAYVLFLTFYLFSNILKGQIAFNDAMTLNNSPKSNDGKIILNIAVQKLLANYYPGIQYDQISQVLIENSGNTFFKSMFTDIAAGEKGEC
jgi:hypothetical protein